MFQTLANRFADTPSALPLGERRDVVACAVIETGGYYPFQVPYRAALEIQLYGTAAIGWTEDEAIQNWIETAQRTPAGIHTTEPPMVPEPATYS
ncbi:hypothetical protein [Parasedimentitalea psychrophila]|uniref:Uncharacterized protein n=1 Tax=Parasedimentitalea psychrophila TaxID=2997337 RepID=A0A9Y2P0C9_9RHOB|nr:hypothetical protein [Parasedimentitalea psychrophila]WIY24481.1 hypothetical protein QPJ95_18270 [Parasedimentitalea psychrophila]